VGTGLTPVARTPSAPGRADEAVFSGTSGTGGRCVGGGVELGVGGVAEFHGDPEVDFFLLEGLAVLPAGRRAELLKGLTDDALGRPGFGGAGDSH